MKARNQALLVSYVGVAALAGVVFATFLWLPPWQALAVSLMALVNSHGVAAHCAVVEIDRRRAARKGGRL